MSIKRVVTRYVGSGRELVLVGITLLLLLLAIWISVWSLTFLGNALRGAINTSVGPTTPSIRFDLDAARNLGVQ